jgi:predicted peroxiredoxin
MAGKLLVHIVSGVENPTRAALGLLVARSALEAGNEVDLFIAGDGVSMLRTSSAEQMNGIGTGSVSEHLAKLREGGAGLYASGMSAAARGLSADDLKEIGFSPAPPTKLVELTFNAERTLTY